MERPTTAEHIKKHETITAAQEFGGSEMGNSKNNEISQPRPVMKPGSAEVDKSSTVNYIYQENEIPADRPHSQDNQEKIKRPNIGQVAPEPELKQPGQPSGRLQKETQVKRPSIQNYSGNKEGSAMKTGMRGDILKNTFKSLQNPFRWLQNQKVNNWACTNKNVLKRLIAGLRKKCIDKYF